MSGTNGRRALLPLLFVLGLATLARLWSIGHGLPYTYYNDEQHLVDRSLSFGSGDLNPHWFHKPTGHETGCLRERHPLLLAPERLEELLEKARKADPRGQFTAHYDTYLEYRILEAEGQKSYDISEMRMPWWRKSEPSRA